MNTIFDICFWNSSISDINIIRMQSINESEQLFFYKYLTEVLKIS